MRKKLEIVYLYFQGFGYEEIARRTGTSKGSVANVVNELRSGQFPEIARGEEVDLLREVAVNLRKLGLDASKATVGLMFYQRLAGLSVEPAQLEALLKMLRDLKPDDVATEVFVGAALRLHQLVTKSGRGAGELIAEVEGLEAKLPGLRHERDSLVEERQKLGARLKEERGQVEQVKAERLRLQTELAAATDQLEHTRRATGVARRAVKTLDAHVTKLRGEKTSLVAEIRTTGDTLAGLQDIEIPIGELRPLLNHLEVLVEKTGRRGDELLALLFEGVEEVEGVLHLEAERDRLSSEGEELNRVNAERQGNRDALEGQIAALQGEVAALRREKAELESFVELTKKEAVQSMRASADATAEGARQACRRVIAAAESVEVPIRQITDGMRLLREEMKALEEDGGKYEHVILLYRFLDEPASLSYDESRPVVMSIAKSLGVWSERHFSATGSQAVAAAVAVVLHQMDWREQRTQLR